MIVAVKPIKVANGMTYMSPWLYYDSVHAVGMQLSLNSSHQSAIIEVTCHGYGVGRAVNFVRSKNLVLTEMRNKIRYEEEK